MHADQIGLLRIYQGVLTCQLVCIVPNPPRQCQFLLHDSELVVASPGTMNL